MFESLGITEQDLVIAGAGLGAFVAAVMAAVKGARSGRPSQATTQAVATSCAAAGLGPQVAEIGETVDDLRGELRDMRDILVRIEDRTSRG